ncbi:DUF262 domain-containing protein [Neptunomonas qingdaonensis]|uniref:Uncharacterized protein n=1 Tax=Neptunomonas qingdaonensis TaxID=1045558 RepID=A0A1I2TY45_9GAMM|nr:DUF262 domain-containing protein [Neptunomonas qingdaonensis]SFG68277.1 Protein of unknown function DUF262 [Neptunomonas qingdaonensis]
MPIISKEVVTVKNMLEMPLVIPDYQRPYKWLDSHVNQLFDDLLNHRYKNRYRLGTVVLHKEALEGSEQELSIVDGQQRLLTLTLLCHMLDKNKLCQPNLLEQVFSSPITIENLSHNAAVIDSRANQLSESDREYLVDFLLNRCELICVKLDDLSEAFQFFDSQNARGKPLEPYDLLKAFHLREMVDNTELERTQCVAIWESKISPEPGSKATSLHTIMSDSLFRLRSWTAGSSGRAFTRHHINAFKGVNLRSTPYRHTETLRALDYMVDQYNADSVRHWDQQTMCYPFQIGQPLLNGKRFFEYIQHYIATYENLFLHDKSELKDLLKTINNYSGRNRIGDHYVRTLFECAVLYYFDKFGDVELEKVAQRCFIWSYSIRLTKQRVALESIDNEALEDNSLLKTIQKALHPHEVLAFIIPPLNKSELNAPKNVQGLVEKFTSLGYLQS